MIEPRKIRVLYFDGSANTLERFAELCGCRDIIDIVAAFNSFNGTAPLLAQDEYRFFELLDVDVAVIHLTRAGGDTCELLRELKRSTGVKLVGLLSAECAADRSIAKAFDYFAEEAGADGIRTDEDVYTHLFYQIKTARLAKTTEKAGVKGKWAILPPPRREERRRRFDVVAMGASAGGTEALTAILSALPAELPPILAVQHIPENFSEFFANNLASRVSVKVVLAKNNEKLEDGTVYLAAPGTHLELARDVNGGYCARCMPGEKVSGHRPSVDVLFRSVAAAAGDAAVGVILTGMGNDGAQGLLEMREAGAYTIGQDKETCAVYGMPMVAYNLGAVCKQIPLGCIAKAILSAVSQSRGEETEE